MMGEVNVSGIQLASLEEAFEGSEDVLAQMLALFQVQAAERLEQLEAHLAAWNESDTRTVLHSLVNICGAVRAYAMSELAKAVGDAVKRDDRALAQSLATALHREAELVLAQVSVLLNAARNGPEMMWTVVLPTGSTLSPTP